MSRSNILAATKVVVLENLVLPLAKDHSANSDDGTSQFNLFDRNKH